MNNALPVYKILQAQTFFFPASSKWHYFTIFLICSVAKIQFKWQSDLFSMQLFFPYLEACRIFLFTLYIQKLPQDILTFMAPPPHHHPYCLVLRTFSLCRLRIFFNLNSLTSSDKYPFITCLWISSPSFVLCFFGDCCCSYNRSHGSGYKYI